MEAFARVAARAELQTGLHWALRDCEIVADWHVPAKAHAQATEGRDPLRVLASLCTTSQSEDVRNSTLCEQAFLVHPQLERGQVSGRDAEARRPRRGATG